MRTKDKSRRRSSWLALETVIIIGLSVKLALTVIFLLVFPGAGGFPFETRLAYAQDMTKSESGSNGEAGVLSPSSNPPTTKKSNKLIQVLDSREKELKKKEGRLNERAKGLHSREKELKRKKGRLNERAQVLDSREKELKKKEGRLNERAKALDALEKDLNKRLTELEATRKKLAALVKKNENLIQEQKIIKNARIEHLVSAYKSMRPEKAGALVDNLDDDVAVRILSAMPGRNAGQILGSVNPRKAARLTKAISTMRGSTPEKEKNKPAAPLADRTGQEEKQDQAAE